MEFSHPHITNGLEGLEPDSVSMFFGDPAINIKKRPSAFWRVNDADKRLSNPAYGRDRMNHMIRLFKRAPKYSFNGKRQTRPHLARQWMSMPVNARINEEDILEYERRR